MTLRIAVPSLHAASSIVTRKQCWLHNGQQTILPQDGFFVDGALHKGRRCRPGNGTGQKQTFHGWIKISGLSLRGRLLPIVLLHDDIKDGEDLVLF